MSSRKIVLLGVAALSATPAFAYPNYCQDRSLGNTRAICAGRSLPSSQVRNIKNHELVCTSNVDNYVRFPQTQVSQEEWSNLVGAGMKKQAYDLKRTLPPIQWSGRIPYETVEEWEYEDCELVTQAIPCGTHEVCEQVSHDVTDYDKDGNVTGSHTVTETVCHQEPNTCWADVTHSASQFCSNETMTFSAHYERPSEQEWNINTPGYYDVIPNKYDLLPGEVEVVQIYNTSSRSSTLRPAVHIGDAWNKYDTTRLFGNAVGARCTQNARLSFDLTVKTIERDTSRATPNAFRLPVDWEGNKLEPLLWKSAVDKKGNTIDRAIPEKLRLDDTSGGIISLMAEQSRRTAERELAKNANGQGANPKDRTEFEKIGKKTDKSGFWKATQVRVKLYRELKYWWDNFRSKQRVGEVEAISPTLNSLSDRDDVKFSDFWVIPLSSSSENSAKDFKGIMDKSKLTKGRLYRLEVSVYQPHVPFYKQSCDDNPNQSWRCRKFWRWWGFGIKENRYFSKPLTVEFRPETFGKKPGMGDRFMTWVFGDQKTAEEKAEAARKKEQKK
jgi:hypothetical protein